MNREIKFKCWIYKEKRMIHPKEISHISFQNNTCYWYDETADINPYTRDMENHRQEQCVSKNVDVMQFTGLKDKNGKDIYEGDIIKSKFNQKESELFIVDWDNCNPCFVLKSIIKYNYGHKIEYDFIQCDLRVNEIIGNVHQNIKFT